MRNICGIDYAPLVLSGRVSLHNIALSDYVNDYRTVGAMH
jgi:hypothetical protein